ncbi:MAG: DUF4350 domain-containing protein [Acidimicrobiales bacterium]
MTAATRARVPRGAVIGVGVAVALLLAAYAGGRPGDDGPPLDPRSDGPLGTSALVSLLERLGAEVELSVGLPTGDDDVALLLQDRLTEEQAIDLEAWVRGGGTLVVTDPTSRFTPTLTGPDLTLDPSNLEPGSCTIAALADVEEVDGGSAARYEVAEVDDLCFGDREDGAFVVARAQGGGDVIAVGGAAFATNELLDEADNAVLAATLLAPAPGGRVRFVEAPVPAGGGDDSLGDLVPDAVKRALAQLAVAFVLYALWRAIRLGKPVVEDQPVEIASSELVAAIGRLLGRTRSPGAAAETMRGELRRTLRARLGVPVDAPPTTLAEVTAARTGASVDDVLRAVDDRPVTTDDELLAVARSVAAIHQEVPS